MNIIHDPLLNSLFTFYKNKQYNRIHECIRYISLKKNITNKYLRTHSMDKYLYSYSQDHIDKILNIYYKSIIIYKHITTHIKKKNIKSEKKLINEENLYGESIKDCKEIIIYIRCEDSEDSVDSSEMNSCKDKYYAFPSSELNKIITHSLLFMGQNSPVIHSKYPKNPWTNTDFNITQLEYIMYMFRYHSLYHHRVIHMFADCNFSITKLTQRYEYYLYTLSIDTHISLLTKKKFKVLFQSFWIFITSEFPSEQKIYHSTEEEYNKIKRIGTKVCKHCIMSIPNIQTELHSIITKYYRHFYKMTVFTKEDIKRALSLKKKFVTFLDNYHPHVYKHSDYYHLHYNKYITTKHIYGTDNTVWLSPINLPIIGFTDDCNIIYDSNGDSCIRQGQILITI